MTAPAQGGARRLPFGLAGMVLVDIGAVLIILSLTTLTWYSVGHGLGAIKFSTLHDLSRHAGGSRAPRWYFSWLAWVLFALAILSGWLSTVPSPIPLVLRGVGVVVAVAGIVATYWALHKVVTPDSVFSHSRAGVWLMFAGFVLTGVGALVGPHGARSATITP